MGDSDTADLGKALGASEAASVDELTLFIPSHDRTEKPIDQRLWLDRGVQLLVRAGGGVTIQPCSGLWFDPDSEVSKRDDTIMAWSYVDGARLEGLLGELRTFIHDLGREANQGEVVIIYNGSMLKFRDFDQS